MVRPRGENSDEAGVQNDPDHLRRVLIRAVERQCPPALAAHREDFVQLALLKVLDHTRSEGKRPLRASYLWKVAYTVIIDEIRRVRRVERYGETLAGGDAATPGPEARSEIQDCLARLQDRRRTAVALYLEGFGTAEVAQALGWKEKQAENLIYRGIADLRLCLEGGEP